MRTKAIIMLALIQSLMGCAAQAMGVIRGGENAAYGATNNSSNDVEQVRVIDAKPNSDFWVFSQSYQPAAPRVKYGFGGNQYRSDTGHKVPEAVLVTWRELPAPGQPPYTGTLHGPYKVQIRERIPKEVLAMAKEEGLVMQVSLTAGQLPILFNWMLTDFQRSQGKNGRIVNMCIGGESFTDPNLKSIKTGVDYREGVPFDVYTPVWPNCTLP